jgi:hypothetical protein
LSFTEFTFIKFPLIGVTIPMSLELSFISNPDLETFKMYIFDRAYTWAGWKKRIFFWDLVSQTNSAHPFFVIVP